MRVLLILVFRMDHLPCGRIGVRVVRVRTTYSDPQKICQTLSRLMEMTYMILYEEESQGLEGPEKVSTRWPARCHVTRRRAQRDCPK